MGAVGPAMDLWTTPARCPQSHSHGNWWSGLLLVAVALAVAEVLGLSRRPSSRSPAPIAFDVQLENSGMVDEAVYGGERHGGIRKHADPVAEGLICRDHQAAAFVSGSDQLEQHRGFGLIFADVAEVLEDEQMVFVQLLDGAL